jgi:hypothetical protein
MGLFSSQKALFLLVFGCFSAVFSAPASDETCLFCLDLIHSLGTNLHSSHPQRIFEPKSREKCAISCRYARHGVENIDLWAWETLRMKEKQHFEQFRACFWVFFVYKMSKNEVIWVFFWLFLNFGVLILVIFLSFFVRTAMGSKNIDLWAWETLRMKEKQHFEDFRACFRVFCI